MSELEKIRHLCTSVDNDSEIRATIKLYFTNFPRMSDQTFADLAQRMVEAFDNQHQNSVNEFANIVVQKENDAITQLMSENNRLKKENHNLRANHKAPQALLKTFPSFYCWSHGHCGHKGSDCKYPRYGHIGDATGADPKGGSLRNYADRK